LDPNWERLGRLPPEKKLEIMFDMINASTRFCADNIRAQNPGITDAELIEKVRERLEWRKRGRVRGIR